MATKKKVAEEAASTKPAKKAVAKTIKVKYQKPGEVPSEMKLTAGTTLAVLAAELFIEGYTISLNGSTVDSKNTTELKSGDFIRVGLKTKNA